MPGRTDGVGFARQQPASWALRHRPRRPWQRIAVLTALLLLITAVFAVVNRPGLAIYMYALIPLVLGVHWFELAGGLAVAAGATVLFVGVQPFLPANSLSGGALWVAAFNRSIVFVGVAVLLSTLFRRERRLAGRVRAQQDEISELAPLRAALTPATVPQRPQLEFATSFTPADGPVAGDFFLVVEGPGGSTTVAVGDVVGHGLDAARCAAFVRAALATFARFSSDPVELLQLANAALVEHDGETRFVTAVCLNIGPGAEPEVTWASAGHDVPWFLDTGAPLPAGRVGAPLGIGADALKLEAGRASLPAGAGILVFTDGLIEGRAGQRGSARPVELFGEQRARAVVSGQCGAPAAAVLQSLVDAVRAFAGGPLADDLCLVAVRAHAG